MQTVLVLFVAVATAGYVLFNHFLAVTPDPREPPFVSSRIPVIGHIIGLIRYKGYYYNKLRDEKKTPPIYSLAMPGGRIYVVNKPEIIRSVERQPKIMSFLPFEVNVSNVMTGVSKEGRDIISAVLNDREEKGSIMDDWHKAIIPLLALGPGLSAMNRAMTKNVVALCDKLQRLVGTDGARLQLYKCFRHEIGLATTDAIYGPKNPFKDPKVESAFWDYNTDMDNILIGFMPSIIARKGVRGRQVVADAFKTYFANNDHLTASDLPQIRYNVSVKHGMSAIDFALCEVSGAFAILANTTPAVFWSVWHIYSRSQVLVEIRDEISKMVNANPAWASGTDGPSPFDVDVIKNSCPILSSTLSEVLRIRARSIAARKVMEDHLLDGKYLLKKDSVILMPSHLVHSDSEVWGPDVDEFNHKRFMKGSSGTRAGFRSFGGGVSLCPGRHFVIGEIMVVVVMFVLGFDIMPVGGEWTVPKNQRDQMSSGVADPGTDIEVDVRRREGVKEGVWPFNVVN